MLQRLGLHSPRDLCTSKDPHEHRISVSSSEEAVRDGSEVEEGLDSWNACKFEGKEAAAP